MPSKYIEANSRHTYDVTIWLSRTTDNSNIFIRFREVRDNESRLYVHWYFHQTCMCIDIVEIQFGIINGQILSILTVICLPVAGYHFMFYKSFG